jgi:exodeoxyribonuclease VII small subunit
MPPNKQSKKTEVNDKSPSFEDALEELEAMVERMESGQLPLEKLISNYERGAELIGHCESVLENARKRLDLITLKPKSAESKSSTDSTDNSNPVDAQEGASSSPDHNDDEIRLF